MRIVSFVGFDINQQTAVFHLYFFFQLHFFFHTSCFRFNSFFNLWNLVVVSVLGSISLSLLFFILYRQKIMRSLVWNFINAKRLTFCLYQTIAFKLSDRFSNEPNKVVYLESFCFFIFLFWVSAFRLFVTLPIFDLKSCAFKIQSHLNTISIAFAIAISITIETKFTFFLR